mgnify:CR=1 FL=1|jgi:hypothetical protein
MWVKPQDSNGKWGTGSCLLTTLALNPVYIFFTYELKLSSPTLGEPNV